MVHGKTDFQNGPTQGSGLLSGFERIIAYSSLGLAKLNGVARSKGLAKVFRMAGESCIADTKTAHSM
jgi:hypothetical protein